MLAGLLPWRRCLCFGIRLLPAGHARFRRVPWRHAVQGRFNHIGAAAEWSLSFFGGYNHLPLIDYSPRLSGGSTALPVVPVLDVQRFYPRIRTYGGDAAVPLSWATLKAEASYFTSTTPEAGEYLLYVLQLERQSGEWAFVGGYTGEVVTRANLVPDFNPERGLARSFVGRADYTIDAGRSVALEGVVRQNGEGVLLKGEYSQAMGRHWRMTAGLAAIRGQDDDFIGHFHRNSFGSFVLRYSF